MKAGMSYGPGRMLTLGLILAGLVSGVVGGVEVTEGPSAKPSFLRRAVQAAVAPSFPLHGGVNITIWTDGLSPESMTRNFLTQPVMTRAEVDAIWPLFLNASCELAFGPDVSKAKTKPRMALFLANNTFELTFPRVSINHNDLTANSTKFNIHNLPLIGDVIYDSDGTREWNFMWFGGFVLSAEDWSEVDPFHGAQSTVVCTGWEVCNLKSPRTCAYMQHPPSM